MKNLILVALCIWHFQIQAAEDKKAPPADTTVTKPVPHDINQEVEKSRKIESVPAPNNYKEIKELLNWMWWEQYRRRTSVT